jgi:hypothetical protein
VTPEAVTLMDTNGMQYYLFEIFLATSIGAYLVWVSLYTATVPWWKNMLGRHQVIASGFVEFLLVMLFIFTVIPAWQRVTAWILVVAAGLLAGMMLWRITIWRRLEIAARALAEQPDEPGPPAPG